MATGQRTHFTWATNQGPILGKVNKPIATVALKKSTGDWQTFIVLVDSGATISIFNRDDCDLLGYKLKNGQRLDIQGVTGHSIPCYVHSVEMRVGTERFQTRVAFSDSEPHELLLGRIDVFDRFEVDLRGKTLDTFLVSE